MVRSMTESEDEGDTGEELPAEMQEEGHFFDFIDFYRKAEFCDRAIRLEIMEEGKKVLCASDAVDSSRLSPSASSKTTTVSYEQIPVSSIVLAAKSCVLRAMLSNGMKESDKSTPVTLMVTGKEKAAFKEMLHFLYAGVLSPQLQDPTSPMSNFIDLLVVADKFEVPSLMGAVIKRLRARSLDVASSVELLSLVPEALAERPGFKHVADLARASIFTTFGDVRESWFSPQFAELGMETVELLLQSDKFQSFSEELVVDAVLGWVRANFDEMQARREAMLRLSTHIELRCLGSKHLEMVRNAPEMQSQAIQGLVHDLTELRSYVDGHERDWPPDAPCFGLIPKSHLEIIGTFRPGRNCIAASKPVLWFGWRLQVCQVRGFLEKKKGLSLRLKAERAIESRRHHSDVVQFAFCLQDQLSGEWKFICCVVTSFEKDSSESIIMEKPTKKIKEFIDQYGSVIYRLEICKPF